MSAYLFRIWSLSSTIRLATRRLFWFQSTVVICINVRLFDPEQIPLLSIPKVIRSKTSITSLLKINTQNGGSYYEHYKPKSIK